MMGLDSVSGFEDVIVDLKLISANKMSDRLICLVNRPKAPNASYYTASVLYN